MSKYDLVAMTSKQIKVRKKDTLEHKKFIVYTELQVFTGF